MDGSGGIEVLGLAHPAMTRRLANLLMARRAETGQRLYFLARASGGRWSRTELVEIEAGRRSLDPQAMVDVAELYGADLSLILPRRLPLTVTGDSLSTGGVTTFYRCGDRESLLWGYLSLVRQLRQSSTSPILELRRSDIEALATFLHDSPAAVVDQLARMVGANRRQRNALAALLTTGVGVLTVGVMSLSSPTTVGGRGREAAARTVKSSPGPGSMVRPVEAASATDGPIIMMSAPSVSIAARAAMNNAAPRRLADAGRITTTPRRPAAVDAAALDGPASELWRDEALVNAALEELARMPVSWTMASGPPESDPVWRISVLAGAARLGAPSAAQGVGTRSTPAKHVAGWDPPAAGTRVDPALTVRG